MTPKLTFFFVGFILLSCCSSQSKAPMPGDIFYDEKCYYNGNLSPRQRSNKKPFSQSKTISVISFSASSGKTPLYSDTLNKSEIKEEVRLSANQINVLTDILYNYNFNPQNNLGIRNASGCYYPRHAIVFYSNGNKVSSYIEICLECKEVKSELGVEETGYFCSDKYKLLEDFFQAIGIKFFKG